MPKYDDTLIVTPQYRLRMQARVERNYEPARERPIHTQRVEFPARIGVIDLTGFGYPYERYGSMTIADIAEMLYDGTGIHKSRKEARDWIEKARAARDEGRVPQDRCAWWLGELKYADMYFR